MDVKTGKPTMLTGPGRVESFSVGEKEIVLSTVIAEIAGRAAALTIKGGDLRALPRMNEAALAQIKFGEPEQFTFAGADGETVYGYVMKPANFKAGAKYPVAFIVHGGPQGSFGNSVELSLESADLRGRGLRVGVHRLPRLDRLRPGLHRFDQPATGAASRSKTCRRAWRPRSQNYPWLDGSRMCALGASYGGYMINWIAGNWAEPFKCLVNHDGIFDTRAMAYSTEELWFAEWEHGGPPYEVPENVEKFNPVNHVAQVEQADAGDPRHARLPRAVCAGHRGLHGPAAPRHPQSPADFPGRKPLGAEAQQQRALAPGSGEVAGSVDRDARASESSRVALAQGLARLRPRATPPGSCCRRE